MAGSFRAKVDFPLRGAVCVVTGASSGLGRRFAIDLASAGAVVVGIARRSDLLATLESEMKRRSTRSSVLRCDVSDVGEFVRVLGSVESEHGRIDVLVNCAGIGEPPGTRAAATGDRGHGQDPAPDVGHVLGAYREVMETNFFAAVAGAHTVLPGMLRRGSGIVVNVSSDSARAPGPGEPAYCASKAALSAFTESLALSVEQASVPGGSGGSGTSDDAHAASGVHVHVLYPGWVPTAMGTGAVEGGMPAPPKMVRRTEKQVSRLLLARMGGPRIDIDATLIARLAPIGKTLAPAAYKKAVLKTSGNPG
ncbi:MAG: SDR family NAD(P)-dependent oxidoreductase [Acidimicrobiales bacterium]